MVFIANVLAGTKLPKSALVNQVHLRCWCARIGSSISPQWHNDGRRHSVPLLSWPLSASHFLNTFIPREGYMIQSTVLKSSHFSEHHCSSDFLEMMCKHLPFLLHWWPSSPWLPPENSLEGLSSSYNSLSSRSYVKSLLFMPNYPTPLLVSLDNTSQINNLFLSGSVVGKPRSQTCC